eukprot:gene5765-5696_t
MCLYTPPPSVNVASVNVAVPGSVLLVSLWQLVYTLDSHGKCNLKFELVLFVYALVHLGLQTYNLNKL